MSSVTARINYLHVQNYLNSCPDQNKAILEQWREAGSLEVFEQMRIAAPVKTGFLREGITRKRTLKGFVVYPTASYSIFVERGTKPHLIFPNTARVLRWFGMMGNAFFAKKVMHPGTPPRWFIRNTRDMMQPILKQLFLAIWREKQ